MKNTLMIMLAAGGLFLATSEEANAQSWRTRSSGFGISLNYGNPGYGYNGYRDSYRGLNHGYVPSYGYGRGIGYSDFGRSRYPVYNNYRVPSYRYVAPRRYDYGCRYGY